MATEARPKRGRHAQWDEKTIKLAVKAVLVDHRSQKSVATECSGGSVVAVRCGLVVTVRTWAKKRLSSSVTSACKLSCLQF